MTNINEQLQAINIQQSTLSIITSALAAMSDNNLYLTFGSAGNYDATRINTIRAFLTLEKNIVEGIIDDYLNNSCVSGC